MSPRSAGSERCAIKGLAASLALAIIGAVAVTPAHAHCDGLDGPVVAAAQQALQTGDLKRVLIWVRAEDEGDIARAFAETLAVRKLGPQAEALADRYFFETLVRIHRAGEGAPFTGLKPAGRDLGPAIPAADNAIETGSAEALDRLLADELREGLRKRFQEVIEKKAFAPDDVAAGRAFVEAYVAFIHYVENLHQAAERPVEGHYKDTD